MALRSNAVLIGAVVVTAVVVAGLSAVSFGEANSRPDFFGNTETPITLRPHGGPCELASKATGVIAKKGGKITWTVKNECSDVQTVTVGNFRSTADPVEAKNCDTAIAGVNWLFEEGTETDHRRTAPGAGGTGHIKLRLKSTTLPETYYFDVCLGTDNGGKKTDPRLIIDP